MRDPDDEQRHQKARRARARAREAAVRTEDRVIGRQSLVDASARPASAGPGRRSTSELLPPGRMSAVDVQRLLDQVRTKLVALEAANRDRDAAKSAVLASEIAVDLEQARQTTDIELAAAVAAIEQAAQAQLAAAFQPSA